MNIELALKDLLPFGSVFFGAVTGGLITFTITRSKETKEARQKQVESILELEAELSRMQSETMEFKTEVAKLQYKINSFKDIDKDNEKVKFYENLNKYFDKQILGKRETLCTPAIHIDEITFIKVRESYNDLFVIFGKTRKSNFQGDIILNFDKYLEVVIKAMEEILLKINELRMYLRMNEVKYTNLYLKKYIKKISN